MSINEDKIRELFATELIDLAIEDLESAKNECEETIESLLYSGNDKINKKLEHAIHKYKARFRNLGINNLTAILQEAETSVLYNQMDIAQSLWEKFKNKYPEHLLEFYMVKDAVRRNLKKRKIRAEINFRS